MTEEELDQMSFRLFKTFARCEYALKAAGFRVGDHRRVDPDWTSFAQAIPNTFDAPNSEALTRALAYIQERPPLKQVLVDDALDWSNAAPQAVNATDLVLQYVRRVRNNLFHGGKFNGRWIAPQRSQELLEHSLTILEVAINAHPDVRQAYHE